MPEARVSIPKNTFDRLWNACIPCQRRIAIDGPEIYVAMDSIAGEKNVVICLDPFSKEVVDPARVGAIREG